MTNVLDRVLDRVPDRVRNTLDNPRLWAVIGVLGLLFAIVALYRTVQEESTRKATTQAGRVASYQACVLSIPGLRKVNRFLEGERDLATVLVQNSSANLASTPAADPQFSTRARNLSRLVEAQRKINTVESLPVPTIDQCRLRGEIP